MSSTAIPTASLEHKYWAFISYSHQDNLRIRGDGSDDHIQWANWLHEQLETYIIPSPYLDQTTRTGDPMPRRFFPTFRDEAELPTSHDLGGQIRGALEQSRFLIVIASPRSARSRYVNEEVRYFRKLGRAERIFTLVVDGEPNVRLNPKNGWRITDDCFCPALVHPINQDGEVDTGRLLTEEPIAADVRLKDSDLPREMKASEFGQPNSRALLDFMKLKLIAGLMGVGLDELVQRDKVRTDEEERLRRRKLRQWLILVAILAFLALTGAVFAWANKLEADQQTVAAKAARDKAVTSRKAADDLIKYMQYDLRGTLSKVGRLSLMDGIDERVAKYHKENPPEVSSLQSERERGVMLLGRGDVLLAKGQLAEALVAYEECRLVFERLNEADPNETDYQRDLASSYSRISSIHTAQGQTAKALQALRDCQVLSRQLVERDSDNSRWQRDLSVTLEKISSLLLKQGETAAALTACQECVSVRQNLINKDPNNKRYQGDLASAYRLLGDLFSGQDQHAAAHDAYLNFLRIAENLAEIEPENAEWQCHLCVAYIKASQVMLFRRQVKEALEACNDALAIAERLANFDHENADWQRDLSAVYSVAGDILSKQNNPEAAANSLNNCLIIREKLAKTNPTNAGIQQDLALIHEKIGVAAWRQEHWEEAAKHFVYVLELTRPWLDRDDADERWLNLFAYSAGCCWEVLRIAPERNVKLDRTSVLADLRLVRFRLERMKQSNRLTPPMAKKLRFIENMLSEGEKAPN